MDCPRLYYCCRFGGVVVVAVVGVHGRVVDAVSWGRGVLVVGRWLGSHGMHWSYL